MNDYPTETGCIDPVKERVSISKGGRRLSPLSSAQ